MKKVSSTLIVVGLIGVLTTSVAWAQMAPERLAAIRGRLGAIRDAMEERSYQVNSLLERLPEHKQRALSSGALNMIHLVQRWPQIEQRLRQALPTLGALRDPRQTLNLGDRRLSVTLQRKRSVSLRAFDLLFSSVAGITQSETHTAWCGRTVLIGYNDSGSIFESIFFGPGGVSSNGYARAKLNKTTREVGAFTDLSFLNPGADVNDALLGDPVLGCSNSLTFYHASLFSDVGAGTSDISVSKSTDGGVTFGAPVVAASRPAATHFLDKPWFAVDPTNLNRLFVTYTAFGLVQGEAPCGVTEVRTAIELVRSIDGGANWGAPVVIAEVCGAAFVQGPQVAVGPNGEVYVAWETIAADFVTREIDISRSDDNGVSFGVPVKVVDVTCVGDCGGALLPAQVFQGGFRTGFENPSLAVDRSGKSTNGNVYVAWHDARNLTVLDAFSGTYGYADVFVVKSPDMGATWNTPKQVNTNNEPLGSGLGTDQFMPGIAVDRRGHVGACFYDRRRDGKNFLIDRYCAKTKEPGKLGTWENTRVTADKFAPVTGQDFLLNPLYMGDYDNVANNFTSSDSGFIGAYADNIKGNPDVKANQFK